MNKKIIAGLAVMFAGLHAHADNAGPSFDCAKASSQAEMMICSDPDLANLDAQLSTAYKAALSKANDQAALKHEEIEWMKKTRNACADVACLKSAYQQRLQDLQGSANATMAAPSQEEAPSVAKNTSNDQHASTPDQPASNIVAASTTNAGIAKASAEHAGAATNETGTTTSKLGEKPSGGYVSDIATSLQSLVVLIFIIGMIKPSWILRRSEAPTRKKLTIYIFAIGMPLGFVAEYTKSQEAKEYEIKLAAQKQAERDARAAQQAANYDRMQAERRQRHQANTVGSSTSTSPEQEYAEMAGEMEQIISVMQSAGPAQAPECYNRSILANDKLQQYQSRIASMRANGYSVPSVLQSEVNPNLHEQLGILKQSCSAFLR